MEIGEIILIVLGAVLLLCIGMFTAVKTVIDGIFARCERPEYSSKLQFKDVEKEFIHVETFKELFPIAKSFVVTLTANAGIPPIFLKNIDIENQEIYRMEMGK